MSAATPQNAKPKVISVRDTTGHIHSRLEDLARRDGISASAEAANSWRAVSVPSSGDGDGWYCDRHAPEQRSGRERVATALRG